MVRKTIFKKLDEQNIALIVQMDLLSIHLGQR